MQVQSLILPHSMPTLASSTGLFVIRVCLRVFGRSVNRVQLRNWETGFTPFAELQEPDVGALGIDR